MKRSLSFASVGSLVLAQLIPAISQACPACASRSDSHPWATAALIGSLISMPYIVGAVVVRAVRRLDDREQADGTSAFSEGSKRQ